MENEILEIQSNDASEKVIGEFDKNEAKRDSLIEAGRIEESDGTIDTKTRDTIKCKSNEDNNKTIERIFGSYGVIIVLLILITGASVTLFALTNDTINVGSSGLFSKFSLAKEDAKNETKQKFYNYYYETAEEKFHVSNSTDIVVSNLQKKSKLEVLRVCETYYSISKKNENELGAEIWIKYIAHGTFTIDMTRAEFIVDDTHNCVKVRVPKPMISDFNIDTEDKLFYKRGIQINDYSDSISVEETLKQKASLELKRQMLYNQDYISSANEHGIQIIENLVRNVNCNNTDLKIIIEYVE